MDIKLEIVAMMNEFLRINGHNPTQIHLTLRQENELLLLPEIDPVKGPRATYKNGFCGIQVNWDAQQFKVE